MPRSNAGASILNIGAPRSNVKMGSNSGSSSGGIIAAATNTAGAVFSGWASVILAVLVLMVLFAVYYQTIGYYINIGWEKLRGSHDRGERIDIGVPGVGLGASLKPAVGASGPSAAGIEQSLSGALQDLESDVAAALGEGGGRKEVFNVARNLYTYHDAEPLCRAYGASLATYDQVKAAYEKGADWCNYGWAKGQLALYPTQKETYDKLQHGPEHERMSCGRPGVNGGYFPNADQRFGVNCYGVRPAESALDERIQMEAAQDTAFDKEVNHYKAELDSIAVNPWNRKQWSA